MSILVLGDAFLDTYHIGKVRGLSAEAPIPILDIVDTKSFPGGAGNVVMNLVALKVSQDFSFLNPSPLPVKNRLETEDGLQLARWDVNDQCQPITLQTECPTCHDYIDLTSVEGIVVSDYGKGAITPGLVEYLLAHFSCPIYVDTKSDPRQWIGAENAILFPNLKEYHQFQDSYDWLPRVVLKQSEHGLAWMEYGRVILSRPAYARQVVSVNGAGDTVLAAFVKAHQSNLDLPYCLDYASFAAGVVCEKPFTSTVTDEEIIQFAKDTGYEIHSHTHA